MLRKHDELLSGAPAFKEPAHEHKSFPNFGIKGRRDLFKSSSFFVIIATVIMSLISGACCAVEVEETSPSASAASVAVTINKPRSSSPASADHQHRNDAPNAGWPHFSTEYVRCFCNLPMCVSSGYMCKSGGGGCFSDLQDEGPRTPSYRGRHGCLELITDKEQRSWCERTGDSKASTKKKQHSRSLFHCCYEDMCNHADNRETRLLLNSSLFDETVNNVDNQITETQEDPLYTNSEVWFRAAIIAVPICGLVIVLALVLLAVRLLQPEPEDMPNHKLSMPSYILTSQEERAHRHNKIVRNHSPLKNCHHHNPIFSNHMEDYSNQTYAPLLIQKEINVGDANCDKKNETNAMLNMLQDDRPLFPYDLTSVKSFYENKESADPDKFAKSKEYHYEKNIMVNEEPPGDNAKCFNTESTKVYGKEPIS